MIVSPRTAIIAACVLAVLGAFSYVLWLQHEKSHQDEVIKMFQAGKQALADHDKLTEKVLVDYREKLSAANNRPPKRVYLCDANGVPAASGGAADKGSPGDNRQDLGPLLREARDRLLQLNALIDEVKPKTEEEK